LVRMKMNNEDLEIFYKFIASGNFDNALDFAKKAGEMEEEADAIIVRALNLKKQLEKYICLQPV